MPKNLIDLVLQEVSLVDNPANQGARVMLFKRDEEGQDDPDDGEQNMPDDNTKDATELQKSIDALEKNVEELTTKLEGAAKRADAADQKVVEFEKVGDKADENEDIFKGLNPEVRERLEKAEKTAETSRTQMAKMIDDKRLDDFTKRASDSFDKYVNSEDFGNVLKVLDDKDQEVTAKGEKSELVNKMETSIKALVEQIRVNDKLTKELGHTGHDGDENTALAKAEVLAKEIVSKQKNITIHKARAMVWEQNPDLYTQYRQESRTH